MFGSCDRAANRFVLCIMRHPFFTGFVLGICTVMFWWTCSRVTLATRNFPVNQMQIFPGGSFVKDIYDGSLEVLGEILRNTDLRFVVYYAPWCAQSQKMVPQMVNAAKLLSDSFDFVAVNCWVGSCKQNFSLHEFPKFFAYHTKYPPVEYLEPPEAWRMVKFLQMVERPFHYIGNEQNLQDLLASNEAIIIGYFNVNKQKNKRFSVFLETCIASVNKDSKTLFGIITNHRLASVVGFKKHGQILLHQILGQQNYFPNNLNFTAETIFSWISKHHTKFVTKLSPNMVNVDQYISHLKRGPALLLFLSQKESNSERSPELLNEYRHLAAVYHNCSAESYRPVLLSSSFNSTRHQFKPKMCFSLLEQYSNHICDICQYSLADCVPRSKNLKTRLNLKMHMNEVGLSSNSCSCIQPDYKSICEFMSVCCVDIPERVENPALKFLGKVQLESEGRKEAIARDLDILNGSKDATNGEFDALVDAFKTLLDVVTESNEEVLSKLQSKNFFSRQFRPGNMEQEIKMGQLRLQKLRREVTAQNLGGRHRFPNILSPRNFSTSDFIGLRCKTNRTVNFFYLDIDQNEKMARDLGIFEKAMQPRMILTLVDVKTEATFVLNKRFPISYNNVVNFITNYTNGQLPRILRSRDTVADCPAVGTCIHEVTTSTFNDVVLDNSADVFLMYYAPWCGYCKPAAKVFLQLATLFRGINTLRFARINADDNDLPYHYAVGGFPSFILFPMGRKVFSRPYPDNKPIRVEEMKNFLTSYSSFKTRSKLESFLRNVA